MKIGYLGPEGTYTQEAAIELTGTFTEKKLLPLTSISKVFEELLSGNIDEAVLPLANSLAGSYTETLKGLTENKLEIIRSFRLKIKLALGIHPSSNPDKVTEIRSKDTALAECSEFLNINYPDAKLSEVESTAKAMQDIKNELLHNVAAIGSEIGLKLYDLSTIEDDIGNMEDNFTVFILLRILAE